MGAKNSSAGQQEYSRLLSLYQVIQECPEEGLRYLQAKSTQQEYLLRQISCPDGQALKKTQDFFRKRQEQLADNRHLVSLKNIISSQQNQYCMTFYKLYALWEFPQRTLEDQINERILQKRKFQEKQLWSILASCILALSHLQRQDIRHNALKSAAVLINPEGVVQLYDPVATGTLPNYEKLLANRSHPHLYLSPQQTESLKQEQSQASCDPYKTDIWTLGMILLQAGLLCYQDGCYRDQFSRIHWDTLHYNISRFQQSYSPSLANLLEFMLAKDERARPDWAELEQHVIKVEQDQNGANTSPAKESDNLMDRIFATIKSTAKLNPFNNQGKPSLFDNQPLSTSKVEQSPSRSHFSTQHTVRSNMIVKTSDITQTRPFRNIFPTNFYRTYTQIDQNTLEPEFRQSLSPQQQSIQHIETTKNVESLSFQKRHPFSEERRQYVKEAYPQGSRYEGHKMNGLKDGFGEFYFQDGGKYQGQWVKGHMEGNGRLVYQSQKVAYEGQWKNDQFSGKGILYNQYPQILQKPFNYRDFNLIQEYWTKYEGQFLEDMKHGHGFLYLSNGQFFQGQFQYDYAQGPGVFTALNGTTISGRWTKNLMN